MNQEVTQKVDKGAGVIPEVPWSTAADVKPMKKSVMTESFTWPGYLPSGLYNPTTPAVRSQPGLVADMASHWWVVPARTCQGASSSVSPQGYLRQEPTDVQFRSEHWTRSSSGLGHDPDGRCRGRQLGGAYNGKGPRSFDRGPFSLLTLSQVI